MNLIIDFGNSSIKAALFEGRSMKKHFVADSLDTLLTQFQPDDFEQIFVSTVSVSREEIDQALKGSVTFLSHETPLPFENAYATRETLGFDRIAAAAGAGELFPGRHCLTIDIGTCITYDFLKDGNTYLGGSISPGMDMRFRALHTLTAGLPLVDFDPSSGFLGDSTRTSITSGVQWGMQYEIQGMIDKYSGEFGDIQTILCGGGAKFFENRLKGTIFAAPELVLSGLNRILQYNAS